MKDRRERTKPPYIHKGFETLGIANKRNEKLIKWLRNTATNETLNLAAKLESCGDPDHPYCNLGACHMCLRRNRLRLFREVLPYIERSQNTESMTIVSPDYTAQRGELYRIDLLAFQKWLARSLRDVLPPNLIAVGGVDVSINSTDNEAYHWVVHAHITIFGLADGPAAHALRCRIKSRLKLLPVNTSLHIKDVKAGEENKVTSYGLKSIFNWRSTFLDEEKSTSRAQEWATRKFSPSRMDEVELRVWLARWTAADRLILVGVTNPAAPNAIRLRDTPRTPKPSEPMTADKPAKPRATRSTRVKLGRPR
jgi:hypothetical protein